MSVTVSNGQTSAVTAGQTDSGDTVEPGGQLNVLSGGAISGTFDYGAVNIAASGTATDNFVLNSVLLNVYGTAVGTVVYGDVAPLN
jgi:hypothetical protein